MTAPQYPNLSAGTPPLSAPYYGAPLPEAVKRFWKKYAVFTGRASRSEYGWWSLVSGIIVLVLEILARIAGGAGATVAANGTIVPGPGEGFVMVLIVLWVLATVVPSLALLARRLHDVNLSTWFILIGLVPFLGGIALLIMSILPSKPQGQRFDQPVGTWPYSPPQL